MANAPRVVIYGNAGSGKTTMAREVAAEFGVPHLCLDHIAWAAAGIRRPLRESLHELETFIAANPGWVIEGCYGDLLEAALPHCSELRFLNPGAETCVAHARARPWEPSYCESPEEQQRLLEPLIDFIRGYETRQDEYSLARHRAIFDAFAGPKREYA
jgi:adenylate kinase family enzyme